MKESQISQFLYNYNIQAAIFDLDGTMLDNNAYHLKSWLDYLKDEGITITTEEFNKNISGRTNKDTLEYIYQRKMTDEEAMKYTLKKEAMYRQIYKPYLKEVAGLTHLLQYFHEQKIKMAIATSGIQPNIDFMFDNLPIRNYFEEVVNSAHIQKGKPDPEIYLLTAERLGVEPKYCLVFEDSLPGIASGLAAGMHVIALTTSHVAAELQDANLTIRDFDELFAEVVSS